MLLAVAKLARRVRTWGLLSSLGVLLGGPAHAQDGTGPQLSELSVQAAYNQLVYALRTSSPGGGPASAHPRVAAAARALQGAIRQDGGARKALMLATTNLLGSLQDGTFSAPRTLQALQRGAAGNVLNPGPWHPEQQLHGTPPAGPVGTSLHQRSEGDCVGISALKALSTTAVGAIILRRAVVQEADGGYAVNLPGAPDQVYHLPATGLDQYGVGDPAGAALVGALFQYFHLDPHRSSLPTNKVLELLAGSQGQHARLADKAASPAVISTYLLALAPQLGSRVAVVFGGKPDGQGNWSLGDGHAFALVLLDARTRTVYYTNPWNEDKVRSIGLEELTRQAAGATADFETITF